MSILGRLFGSGGKSASIQEEVMRLVARECKRQDIPVPPGASDEAIDALGARTGLTIPIELREWLRACGGFETESGYALLGTGDPTKWGNIDAYRTAPPNGARKAGFPSPATAAVTTTYWTPVRRLEHRTRSTS